MGGVCVEWRKNAPRHRGAPEKWADCGPLPHENIVGRSGGAKIIKSAYYSRFPSLIRHEKRWTKPRSQNTGRDPANGRSTRVGRRGSQRSNGILRLLPHNDL